MAAPNDNRISAKWLILMFPAVLVGLLLPLYQNYRQNGYVETSEVVISIVVGCLFLTGGVLLLWWRKKNAGRQRDESELPWHESRVFTDFYYILMAFVFFLIVGINLYVSALQVMQGIRYEGPIMWFWVAVALLIGWIEYRYWFRGGRGKVLIDKRRKHGLCIGCGYSLKQLTNENCPECGLPISSSTPPANEGLPEQQTQSLIDLYADSHGPLRYFRFDISKISMRECYKSCGSFLIALVFLWQRKRMSRSPGTCYISCKPDPDHLILPDHLPDEVRKLINDRTRGWSGAGFVDPFCIFPPGQRPQIATIEVIHRHENNQYYLRSTISLGIHHELASTDLVSQHQDSRFTVTSSMRKLHAMPTDVEEHVIPNADVFKLHKAHKQRLDALDTQVKPIDSRETLLAMMNQLSELQTAYQLERGMIAEVTRDEYLAHTEQLSNAN